MTSYTSRRKRVDVISNVSDAFDESIYTDGSLFKRFGGDAKRVGKIIVSNRVDEMIVRDYWNRETTRECSMDNTIALNPLQKCATNNVYTLNSENKKIYSVSSRYRSLLVMNDATNIDAQQYRRRQLDMSLYEMGMLENTIFGVNPTIGAFESALLMKYYSLTSVYRNDLQDGNHIRITPQLYYYVREYFSDSITRTSYLSDTLRRDIQLGLVQNENAVTLKYKSNLYREWFLFINNDVIRKTSNGEYEQDNRLLYNTYESLYSMDWPSEPALFPNM
ncbi:gp97-like protein [Phenacoccus solenopsis nudivirus]|nr:gp97-like protein [Phenacoccus solenopsis nudivirus]